MYKTVVRGDYIDSGLIKTRNAANLVVWFIMLNWNEFLATEMVSLMNMKRIWSWNGGWCGEKGGVHYHCACISVQ